MVKRAQYILKCIQIPTKCTNIILRELYFTTFARFIKEHEYKKHSHYRPRRPRQDYTS
jgi:hypothetical protein